MSFPKRGQIFKDSVDRIKSTVARPSLDTFYEVNFSFGKYKNQEIDEVIEKDPGYFSWIMKSDFPNYTKKVLNQLRLNKLNNKLQ